MAVCALVFFDCKKPLELNPTQAIDNDQLIVDALSAEVAMNGLYSNAQDFFGSLLTIEMDLASDITDHLGTFPAWSSLDRNDPLPEEFPYANGWTAAYALIYNANVILEALPTLNAPTLDVNQLTGEARALRAWTYFYLVNLFGDVPLVEKPLSDLSGINVPKSPAGEVLDFVKQELGQAVNELGGASDPNRIIKAAAQAMQAKLFLLLEDWDQAITAADAVIAQGYQLEPAYMDLFGENISGEVIWQLEFNSNDQNQLAFHYRESPGGRHEVGPSTLIVEKFAADDARRNSIAPAPNSANGNWQVAKYSDFATGTDEPILLRLADILLVKAEALAELGQYQAASTLLNQVRGRSLPNSNLNLTMDNSKNLILEERMLELAWEAGNRWLDMQRTPLGEQFLTAKGVDVCRLKWPLPRIEVGTNTALEQNPCY